MEPTIRKIVRELSLKRNEIMFFQETPTHFYIGTDLFVAKIENQEYQKLSEKIIDIKIDKGKEIDKYEEMFQNLKDVAFTNFITRIMDVNVAIYDKNNHYIYLDQDLTFDIELNEFKKVSQNLFVADLSENSQVAIMGLVSESADMLIKESDYFKHPVK